MISIIFPGVAIPPDHPGFRILSSARICNPAGVTVPRGINL
ncbi:MAG TPA: hypothetical protein VK450_02540 [Methanomicrobiales archaeon]|nr:hypothetical protein [Methanomicrobiales archaeon]